MAYFDGVSPYQDLAEAAGPGFEHSKLSGQRQPAVNSKKTQLLSIQYNLLNDVPLHCKNA
jgi:hypothetical protein